MPPPSMCEREDMCSIGGSITHASALVNNPVLVPATVQWSPGSSIIFAHLFANLPYCRCGCCGEGGGLALEKPAVRTPVWTCPSPRHGHDGLLRHSTVPLVSRANSLNVRHSRPAFGCCVGEPTPHMWASLEKHIPTVSVHGHPCPGATSGSKGRRPVRCRLRPWISWEAAVCPSSLGGQSQARRSARPLNSTHRNSQR